LLLIRIGIYLGAVLLFVVPLAPPAGIVSAAVAVPAGVLLAHWLAPSRLRLAALGLGGGGVLLAAYLLASWLGNTVWVMELLGVSAGMALFHVVTWGLGTFGVVFSLRVLAARVPALAVLEAVAVTAAVVYLCAGHRDGNIDQPRSLSDWALSRGHDPMVILLGLGVITLIGQLLLLLRKQNPGKTLKDVLALVLLGAILFCFFGKEPDRDPPESSGGGGGGASPKKVDLVVGVLTFHDDYKALEGSYYLRQDTASKFGRRKMVPSKLPGVDHDTQTAYPTTLTRVPQTGGMVLMHPRWGKVELFRVVPSTMHLVSKDPVPPALARPLTLEPARNPDPKQFLISYNVMSAVLVKAKVNFYEPGRIKADDLRAAGVPAAVLAKLGRLLSDRGRYAEPRFEGALAALLSPEERKRYGEVILARARYQVTANPYEVMADLPADDPSWSPEVRRQYLQGPRDPRYKALADEIIAKSLRPDQRSSAMLKAQAFRQWIFKNTVYTKRMDGYHDATPDPIASYLFGNRKGKCVHIAHAMTYLLRSQGIPARVAGGFAVDPKKCRRPSGFVFRESHRHAWPEMYLQGVGWINVDTGSERKEDDDDDGEEGWVKRILEKANPDDLDEDMETGPAQAEVAGLPWWAFALVLPAVLLALYGVKVWRRLAPCFAGPTSLYRLCYRAALDRLAEVGLYRQFGETREEFAQRVAGLAPEFVALSDAHVREAVAGLPTFDRHTWMELKARIDAANVGAFSCWRRALGLLNPLTWAWVR
jgi:hypothetical protein